jgi:predicted nucleotidyltransferase
MARTKVVLTRDPTPVRYAPERFKVLLQKRRRAQAFVKALPAGTRVFGSVARGDVRAASDIDLEVPYGVRSFVVEVALAAMDDPWTSRSLAQATPNSVVKALWQFGETTVALPLTPPTPIEEGFVRFGGALDLDGLLEGARVPGVDKRLLLIEPTREGHIESSVAERANEAARILQVGKDVIEGRIRVLRRRSSTGRTGIYLARTLDDGESPEGALDALKDSDPAVRRVASG